MAHIVFNHCEWNINWRKYIYAIGKIEIQSLKNGPSLFRNLKFEKDIKIKKLIFIYSNHLLVYSSNYSIKNTRDIQVLWLVHLRIVFFNNFIMWNKILVILYEWWNDDDDNNIVSRELECKEVENYGKVMESHPYI